MKYTIDHDLHIHSYLSLCSKDPEQNGERMLQYAKEYGLKTICVTDHFWDEAVPVDSTWYAKQDYAHIAAIKPLPQDEEVRFLFGCETELDYMLTLGLSKEKQELFDFIIIPTTHMHSTGFTISEEDAATPAGRAKCWVKRLDAVLHMDLPYHKVGIAHLTCGLTAHKTREEFLEVFRLIPQQELERLFTRAAELGAGIELNADDMKFADEETETIMRVYRTAKACGCKFYLGSDAHHPANFEIAIKAFERAINLLELTEDDKFILK